MDQFAEAGESYVQINRMNFPKRFALAQQLLMISGANIISAVSGGFSSTPPPP